MKDEAIPAQSPREPHPRRRPVRQHLQVSTSPRDVAQDQEERRLDTGRQEPDSRIAGLHRRFQKWRPVNALREKPEHRGVYTEQSSLTYLYLYFLIFIAIWQGPLGSVTDQFSQLASGRWIHRFHRFGPSARGPRRTRPAEYATRAFKLPFRLRVGKPRRLCPSSGPARPEPPAVSPSIQRCRRWDPWKK